MRSLALRIYATALLTAGGVLGAALALAGKGRR